MIIKIRKKIILYSVISILCGIIELPLAITFGILLWEYDKKPNLTTIIIGLLCGLFLLSFYITNHIAEKNSILLNKLLLKGEDNNEKNL